MRILRFNPTWPRHWELPAMTGEPGPTSCGRASSMKTADRSPRRTSSTASCAPSIVEVFSLGATWMPDLLENETGFEGPYATPEKDLTSVETPDDRTLIFHFSRPPTRRRLDHVTASIPRQCPRTRTRSRTTVIVPSHLGRTRSRVQPWHISGVGAQRELGSRNRFESARISRPIPVRTERRTGP